MTKFIAKPYQYIGYRQIPNYPLTMLNQNSGVQFDRDGVYSTEDETLIAGLREMITGHERALVVNKNPYVPYPLQEYGKEKMAEYVETAPEPTRTTNGLDDEEVKRIRNLLRL